MPARYGPRQSDGALSVAAVNADCASAKWCVSMAAVPADNPMMIAPGARAQIPTGIALALPPGFEGQVRPRSGLAARHGITVLNTPGTVDADYRGEVMVILINFGQEPFRVERGMRIAQMIIAATMQAKICEVASLDQTDRGPGGFGSTGISGAQNPKATEFLK